MVEIFTVFYSWQSDKKKSSNYISNSVEMAINHIKKKLSNEIALEINFDRDTQNRSGSPQIAQTIFDKISKCDIFICDISLINNTRLNRTFKNRLTSNPNVLIELGYAIHCLGWERIICVNNIEFGNSELLPFDIRGHRITNFNNKDSASRKQLVSILKIAIGAIIDNYEIIKERHKIDSLKQKDRVLFKKISNILPEKYLSDNLQTVVTNLYYDNYMHSIWCEMIDFYSVSMNHFINKDMDKKMQVLIKELESFKSMCYADINIPNNIGTVTLRELEKSQIKITEEMRIDALQNERYFIRKEPYKSESWTDCHNRMDDVALKLNSQKNIILTLYKELIQIYKKELLP